MVSKTVRDLPALYERLRAECHDAYRAAVAADAAWMREIERAFPTERVGDVRYTSRARGEAEGVVTDRALYRAHLHWVREFGHWQTASRELAWCRGLMDAAEKEAARP